MEKFDIRYEILNYDKLNRRLDKIVNNKNNKFKVTKQEPIGKSSCGFNIDHYTIGRGPIHILYMGGCHGDEIIGVDFVTQLMENMALGNGDFENFDYNTYTIDFIPLQNPESFYVTTYALDQIMGKMTEEEIEKFSKQYYVAMRNDNIIYASINNVIKTCAQHYSIEPTPIINKFWFDFSTKKEIDIETFANFIENELQINDSKIIKEAWESVFNNQTTISLEKQHQKMFENVTLDCIPEKDEAHKILKEKITRIYSKGDFPLSTLANFLSNADGVNLNDNNPIYYEIFKNRIKNEKVVYAGSKYNNIIKSIPGPQGMPNYDMDAGFTFAEENKALLSFLFKQDEFGLNFASINCHGTGGLLFLYPHYDEKKDTEIIENGGYVERDFSFLINNILATEYTKATGEVYKEKTNSDDTVSNLAYKTTGYPTVPTGVGDLLRKTFIGAFLLELSKMGGNPIGPYGDRYGNYNLTMESNMKACMNMLKTIKEIKYMYRSKYVMHKENDSNIEYITVPNTKFTK